MEVQQSQIQPIGSQRHNSHANFNIKQNYSNESKFIDESSKLNNIN